MRGIVPAPHYIGVENQETGFEGEAAAIRVSAGASITDAICRVPRLRRAFAAETGVLRQRLQRLEAAGEEPGQRVTLRMIRWFWCVVFTGSAAAFTAGYLLAAGG